jgi:hypothetical protein
MFAMLEEKGSATETVTLKQDDGFWGGLQVTYDKHEISDFVMFTWMHVNCRISFSYISFKIFYKFPNSQYIELWIHIKYQQSLKFYFFKNISSFCG